jgi:mannose-6-phosphate isomerase
MFILYNSIQEYQWGKKEWLPDFLNRKNINNTPWAELWMGAHPKAPSKTKEGESLYDMINSKGEMLLGAKTYSLYKRLPFLFKILAVQEPLSIQVHPSKKQAEEGYARENLLSIPLDASNRNYRDDNHKPEIICAVEPYTAMKGFRSIEEIKKNFKPFESLLDKDLFAIEDIHYFYFSLMEMSQKSKNKIINGLSRYKQDTLEWEWVMKLIDYYPGDISALAPLFLNLIELKKGEALFLPAGELHAYLSGVGIELMANSDNVLRGGLTPKHMDLNELKKIVNFQHSPVKILNKNESDLYPSWADEFYLGQKKISENYKLNLSDNAAILLVFSGEITVTRGEEKIHLKRGDTLFIEADSQQPNLKGRGEVYWASVGERD